MSEVINIKEPREFVASIESLLEKAKAGEVTGYVGYYSDNEGCAWLYHKFDAMEAIGACNRLAHNINIAWDES